MSNVINYPDTLNIDGATRLAKRIEAYWFNQGYLVKARVETESRPNDKAFSCVRSDMVNGYPRSWGVR